jgi:hypothetical protein
MPSSSDSADVVPQKPPRGGSGEVVCLIKRPGYVFALAAPWQSPTRLSLAHAALHAQLTQRDQPCEFSLAPLELEAFYEDLRVVIDYLQGGCDQPPAFRAAPDTTGLPGPYTDTPLPDLC